MANIQLLGLVLSPFTYLIEYGDHAEITPEEEAALARWSDGSGPMWTGAEAGYGRCEATGSWGDLVEVYHDASMARDPGDEPPPTPGIPDLDGDFDGFLDVPRMTGDLRRVGLTPISLY